MAKLDPIFAEYERRLAPGVADPHGAVRDRLIYRSADRDAAARPGKRFPGSSMDVTRPGEFDVSSPGPSVAGTAKPRARDTRHAQAAVGDIKALGDARDAGDIGDIGDAGDIGDVGGERDAMTMERAHDDGEEHEPDGFELALPSMDDEDSKEHEDDDEDDDLMDSAMDLAELFF